MCCLGICSNDIEDNSRDSGLLKNNKRQMQSLYSLRHTHPTLENIYNKRYTLSKQRGNRALMIERHYSKLTKTIAANRLACFTSYKLG